MTGNSIFIYMYSHCVVYEVTQVLCDSKTRATTITVHRLSVELLVMVVVELTLSDS